MHWNYEAVGYPKDLIRFILIVFDECEELYHTFIQMKVFKNLSKHLVFRSCIRIKMMNELYKPTFAWSVTCLPSKMVLYWGEEYMVSLDYIHLNTALENCVTAIDIFCRFMILCLIKWLWGMENFIVYDKLNNNFEQTSNLLKAHLKLDEANM